MAFDIGGVRQIVSLGDESFFGVRASDGELLWSTEFETAFDQNNVTTILYEGMLLLSGYQWGTAALKVEPPRGGGGVLVGNRGRESPAGADRRRRAQSDRGRPRGLPGAGFLGGGDVDHLVAPGAGRITTVRYVKDEENLASFELPARDTKATDSHPTRTAAKAEGRGKAHGSHDTEAMKIE